jgi:hypothetical protein
VIDKAEHNKPAAAGKSHMMMSALGKSCLLARAIILVALCL